MINSLTYLTRGCPRACEYCALRDAKGIGPQLPPEKWNTAFSILKELHVDFNLILGNETWLLGDKLFFIMTNNTVPYALYTTCPEPLFSKFRDKLFGNDIIDNLSCGIDYPVVSGDVNDIWDDSYRKSLDAWKGFTWIKQNYPDVDTQGTITVHKRNIGYLKYLVKDLSQLGVFVGINFIHWNKDGNYDFFPSQHELKDLLFEESDYPHVEEIMKEVLSIPGHLIQNPEFIAQPASMLCNMGWHCKGNPYNGPTIDSDGHLRCCGYRRGHYTPQLTIFDLPDRLEEWKQAVRADALECPGCAWSYPWMTHYWEHHNATLGKKVFSKHAGENIPKEKWSNRKIE